MPPFDFFNIKIAGQVNNKIQNRLNPLVSKIVKAYSKND